MSLHHLALRYPSAERKIIAASGTVKMWGCFRALMSAVKDRGERYWPPGGGALRMIAHRWGQDLKDVGEQALMRGLDTALPILRLGQSLSYYGRRPMVGHKASVGYSPAVILPPPVCAAVTSFKSAVQRAQPTT